MSTGSYMILIKNSQRTYPVDKKSTTKIIQKLLDSLGYSNFDIGIWFTNNKTIALYNTEYRHKQGPTDILSFPYYTELKAGQKIVAQNAEEANLGDIIISLEYVYTSERWQDTPETERLPLLLIHGICHLLGYDHENDKDYEVMRKKELELLKAIK
jgi:probable rRNA maturation factor